MIQKNRKKPEWLRKKLMDNQTLNEVHALIDKCDLNTVCQEAHCPNLGECFSKGTATFMILGNQCTRKCSFCAVSHGIPSELDKDEPVAVARAVKDLGLQYVVITSVTRDDLPDEGSEHYARTIKAIKDNNPGVLVEVLIPDFKGSQDSLKIVVDAEPDVINHNIETVPRLYRDVRPQAVYERSIKLLRDVKDMNGSVITKSGLMVGLGEQIEEILDSLRDLKKAGCEILTIGQYLAPSSEHHPIIRYVTPEEFSSLEKEAYGMGFRSVASGPFVRSSYFAKEVFEKNL